MLHFTMISCFTLAGFSEAPLGLTMLLATLNSLSLLELAAGTVKTILARSESNGNCCWWSFYHSSRCCCQHLAIALSYCIPSHIKLALRSSENVTPASPASLGRWGSSIFLFSGICWRLIKLSNLFTTLLAITRLLGFEFTTLPYPTRN